MGPSWEISMTIDNPHQSRDSDRPGPIGAAPPPTLPDPPAPVSIWNPGKERPAGGEEPTPGRPEVPPGPGIREVPETPPPAPAQPSPRA
jgi:hypothetical protein